MKFPNWVCAEHTGNKGKDARREAALRERYPNAQVTLFDTVNDAQQYIKGLGLEFVSELTWLDDAALREMGIKC